MSVPPNAPKNLSATFRVDIFGGVQWEDTNWSDDIGFAVHRDGAEIAVVDPECLARDDIVCTDFRMYTPHYYGVVDASIYGDSDLPAETCITMPLEGSERLPRNEQAGRAGDKLRKTTEEAPKPPAR